MTCPGDVSGSLDKLKHQDIEINQTGFHLALEFERVPADAVVVAIVEVGDLLPVTVTDYLPIEA
jgi:hypothetical protein